ncbi:hypothetical protein [Curtobacterium sp. Arg-1]|uniref:hypothetical protein n=1 Tax=Curtobacterium sp. Arg-1 TaxID=2935040 RepID=UPI0021DB2776|nr:hypothetical protein [Curtobacterium sp. Arg-1]UXZ57070.1 hypothetical protein MXD64_13830 [Curtobacterium sp. Arg-1]
MTGGVTICSMESGSGCPGSDGGPHYFAHIGPTKDTRICIDCGVDEPETSGKRRGKE